MKRSETVIKEKILQLLQFLHEYQEPCYVYELEELFPSMHHKTTYIPVMKELGYIETVGKMRSRQWYYTKEHAPTIKDAKLISEKTSQKRFEYKNKNKEPMEIKFDRIGKRQIYDWLMFLSKVKESRYQAIKMETKVNLSYVFIRAMLENNIIGKKDEGVKTKYFIKTEVMPNIHMVDRIYRAGQSIQHAYNNKAQDNKVNKIELKKRYESEMNEEVVEENYTLDDFKNHLEILKTKLFNSTGISTEMTVRFTNQFII
jgi:hypothetical protein